MAEEQGQEASQRASPAAAPAIPEPEQPPAAGEAHVAGAPSPMSAESSSASAATPPPIARVAPSARAAAAPEPDVEEGTSLALQVGLRCGLLGGGLALLGLLAGEPLQAWVALTYVVAGLGPAALIEAFALRRMVRPPDSAGAARRLAAPLGALALTLILTCVALAGAYVQAAYLEARWRSDPSEVADSFVRLARLNPEDLLPLGFVALGVSAGFVFRVVAEMGLGRVSDEQARGEREGCIATALGLGALLVGPLLLAAAAPVGDAIIGGTALVALGCVPAGAALAGYYHAVDRLQAHLARRA